MRFRRTISCSRPDPRVSAAGVWESMSEDPLTPESPTFVDVQPETPSPWEGVSGWTSTNVGLSGVKGSSDMDSQTPAALTLGSGREQLIVRRNRIGKHANHLR